MKKIIIGVVSLLIVASIAAVLIFVGGTPKHFRGEWKYSKISSIEVTSNVHESWLTQFKQEYGAEDADSINAAAVATFTANGLFAPYYVNFDGKYTYTYDPIYAEREATWCLYQTGENTGFLSFYTELDAADGNPGIEICPDLVYNAETNTMLLTFYHVGFIVTIELIR